MEQDDRHTRYPQQIEKLTTTSFHLTCTSSVRLNPQRTGRNPEFIPFTPDKCDEIWQPEALSLSDAPCRDNK